MSTTPPQVGRRRGELTGFLRQQEGRDGANLKASQQAWPRVVAFLKRHLQ